MRWPPSAPCSEPCRRPDRRSPGTLPMRTGGPTSVPTTSSSMPRLIVSEPLGQGVALGDRGRLLQQRRLPLVGRPAGEPVDDALQHHLVPLPVGQFRQALRARVVEPTVVHVEQAAQLAPALRAAQVHHHGAPVGGFEDAEDGGLRLAHDAGPVPLTVEDRCPVEKEQAVQQRRFDVLAITRRGPFDQRRAGTQDRQQRGGHAGQREGQPHGVVPGEEALLCAGPGVHEGLPSRLVPRRSRAAPGTDGARDETRPRRPQHGRAETEPLQRARPQVLHQQVGPVQQPQCLPVASLGGQVELDRALAPVPGREAGRIGPQRLTARPLDLYHLGAVVGEDGGRQRRGDVLADLDDLQALEDAVSGHGLPLTRACGRLRDLWAGRAPALR